MCELTNVIDVAELISVPNLFNDEFSVVVTLDRGFYELNPVSVHVAINAIFSENSKAQVINMDAYVVGHYRSSWSIISLAGSGSQRGIFGND